jgi:hypothetical protein
MRAGLNCVGLGSALGQSIIAHVSINLIWINAPRAAFGIQYSMMLKGGELDASLRQSPLVDFQSLERLESSLLELC